MIFGAIVTAGILALALTPLARALALRFHVVDLPENRKIHAHPVPLLGGVAVYLAVAATVLVYSGPLTRATWGVIFGGGALLGIGLVDDARNVGSVKLALEFAIAAAVVSITGLSFHLPWPAVAHLLTILWIVGVVNAFNCLDCADGVAAGIGLVCGCAFLVLAVLTHQPVEVTLAAAIVGASLGFLPFNRHPAKIFLGDAGSLTLGYFVATLGVMVSPGILSVPALAAKAVILAIPIYDILFVHFRRYRRGQRRLGELLTSTGKDHLPHRLMDRGLSHSAAAATITLAAAATGVAGITLVTVHSAVGALTIAAAVAATIGILEREWVAAVRRPGSGISAPTPSEGD
jgi:UDP-GlcNAc:undecaprenyl-phosphate GlcNAc-1-phosphate transferase